MRLSRAKLPVRTRVAPLWRSTLGPGPRRRCAAGFPWSAAATPGTSPRSRSRAMPLTWAHSSARGQRRRSLNGNAVSGRSQFIEDLREFFLHLLAQAARPGPDALGDRGIGDSELGAGSAASCRFSANACCLTVSCRSRASRWRSATTWPAARVIASALSTPEPCRRAIRTGDQVRRANDRRCDRWEIAAAPRAVAARATRLSRRVTQVARKIDEAMPNTNWKVAQDDRPLPRLRSSRKRCQGTLADAVRRTE